MRPFRESVAAAHLSLPILAEAGHGGVVHCHLGVQAPYAPPGGAQPHAKLRLFSRDERLAIAAGILERRGPHHHVSATCAGFACRPIPFPFPQRVVERTLWI